MIFCILKFVKYVSEYRSDISMTSRHDYGKFSPPNSMTSFVSKLQKDKKGEPSKTQKPQGKVNYFTIVWEIKFESKNVKCLLQKPDIITSQTRRTKSDPNHFFKIF